jgi:hypothetical protein
MEITDPGERYQYLTIGVNGKALKVFKDCRVKIFDAFWITEPTPDSQKPNMVMSASDVPNDLWRILTEEERLLSLLAESQRKVASLEREKLIWITATILFGVSSIAMLGLWLL